MDAFENVVKLDGPIDSNDIKGVELKVYLIFYFKKRLIWTENNHIVTILSFSHSLDI